MKPFSYLKVEKKVREYLAEIGRRGGEMSRRDLTKEQARKMVAIREAKRAAIKKGNIAWALKRQPLGVRPVITRPAPKPAVRPKRWIGIMHDY
jgi:hypothetical protein